MNKLIIIDSGYLTHRSIFLWGSSKKKELEKGNKTDPIPASYTYLLSLYSILKRIGYDKSDKVLIACDGKNSFRKAFYPIYKGQRDAQRKSHEEINWGLQYNFINKLTKQLNESTPWNVLQINNFANFCDLVLTNEGQKFNIEEHDIDYATEYGLEADDLMAVAPKVFSDHEVILVTIDKDINQCLFYSNVKIFNPNLVSATNKAKKGFYVIEKDPLKVIQKKVKSGDVGDNIIVDKNNDTEREVEIREFIINLLNLPEWVEEPIIKSLKNLDWNKPLKRDKLPFQNSLAKKFDRIYEKNDLRTYEESLKRHEIKDMRAIEKRSKRTPEELYEKNERYKMLVDKYKKKEKTNAVH